MSTYRVYEQDKGYQEMLVNYFNTKEALEMGAKKGILDPKAIKEHSKKFQDNLELDIKAFNSRKLEELEQERQKIVESYKPQLDYNSSEAKELEVKFKLASQWEIKGMAQELETDNLLETNLLRLELKNRGMDEEEQKVKTYVTRHQLETAHEKDERYQEIFKDISVLKTVGNRAAIVLGEYKPLDHLRNEFDQFINNEIANPSEQEKDLGQYMKKMREFENMVR